MKQLPFFIAICLSLSVVSGGILETAYVEPKNFTDIESPNRSIQTSLEIFDDELKRSKSLQRSIGAGRQLTLAITDFDAAGRVIHQRGGSTRVIKSLYPPKLEFEYSLSDADGRVLEFGKAKLRDPAFAFDIGRRLSSSNYYFEIKLVETWAEQNFRVDP